MFYLSKDQKQIMDLLKQFGHLTISQIKDITGINDIDELIEPLMAKQVPYLKKEGDLLLYPTVDKINRDLLKALDAYSYIHKMFGASWCTVSKFPYILSFIEGNKFFDIALVKDGQESVIVPAMEKSNSMRIIIIVDDEKQIRKISIPGKKYKFFIDKTKKLI
ncbi:DUF5697 family protein [Clostridium sp. MT-14]|uniref:DUF5697 family protein n=1 Tax=Clostridium aromativorans TaxID=2836848 RepID=A0ABS8NB26_9CLOT|nr:DUF5697 family protein [Clostridium aromativorans]MCC9296866.1 DUF5697 family protein [Clostridium aromativorans]CAB1249191.1 conserved hypothetical protein [Clostridiaceae bacterium BL-3]